MVNLKMVEGRKNSMNVFIDSNCIAILNILNETRKGVFGAVRFQKLLFLLFEEFRLPLSYTFYKRDMGPHTKELKADLEYLAEIGFIEEEALPTNELNDLFIYRITESGRNFLSKMNIYREYADRFRLLLNSYGYEKLNKLLDYVHSNYPKDVYAPAFQEMLEVMRADSKLAEMFWERIARKYEDATPFWYLSALLGDVANRMPRERGVREVAFELYSLLVNYSKRTSRYLVRQKQPLATRKDLQNLIYDKCYVILQAVNSDLIIDV